MSSALVFDVGLHKVAFKTHRAIAELASVLANRPSIGNPNLAPFSGGGIEVI